MQVVVGAPGRLLLEAGMILGEDDRKGSKGKNGHDMVDIVCYLM